MGFQYKAAVMFPGHRVLQSNLSHVASPQVSAIKPQSSSQATDFQNQTSVIFPGHMVPESNLSHVCRTHGSTIKPQSCSQHKGVQNQTSVMFPGNRVPEQTSVMLPSHRFPPSNLRHVPRPQGSRIKPFSCSQATGFQNPLTSYSQATGFQNKTSVMFPVHRVPEPSLSHVPRAQYSTI